jgi:restriction system protein
MALWVVRAGRHGDQEETAVKQHVVCHGWNDLPDYSAYRTKDDLRPLYKSTFPGETQKQINSGLGQVWRFAHEIQRGDIVALPLKTESAFMFGRVTGEYEYRKLAPNVLHVREVEWIETLPRSVLPEDILFSMNSALTVFRVERNDAENRVYKILALVASTPKLTPEHIDLEVADATSDDTFDLAETARDEILKLIQDRFKSHALARLIAAILRAQGYKTKVSPPGPDGGVDILAGSGPLGFDRPRLCAQVKSGVSAEGQATFNQLRGVMSKFDCEQGLLVSWGGFTKHMNLDARNDFFKVRLWDQGDVVDAILENYEKLDHEIASELPLRRVWMVAPEDLDPSASE